MTRFAVGIEGADDFIAVPAQESPVFLCFRKDLFGGNAFRHIPIRAKDYFLHGVAKDAGSMGVFGGSSVNDPHCFHVEVIFIERIEFCRGQVGNYVARSHFVGNQSGPVKVENDRAVAISGVCIEILPAAGTKDSVSIEAVVSLESDKRGCQLRGH